MSEEKIDRRAFGAGVAATVAAAALLRTDDAEGQPRQRPPTLVNAPPDEQLAPLPFAVGGLRGLSERMIRAHHETNYGGAVRKLNEIRHQLGSADPDQAGGYWSLYGSLKSAELAARNSVVLHELYFANLAPPSAGDAGVSAPASIGRLIAGRFGSMDRFRAMFRGAAKASSGWVVLVTDPTSRTLEIVQTEGHAFGAWDAAPLLVLDVYEHAYAIDYGPDKGQYFNAFWTNLHWAEVERRATRALSRL